MIMASSFSFFRAFSITCTRFLIVASPPRSCGHHSHVVEPSLTYCFASVSAVLLHTALLSVPQLYNSYRRHGKSNKGSWNATFSSMLPSVQNLKTCTSFFCPMRWARSIACRRHRLLGHTNSAGWGERRWQEDSQGKGIGTAQGRERGNREATIAIISLAKLLLLRARKTWYSIGQTLGHCECTADTTPSITTLPLDVCMNSDQTQCSPSTNLPVDPFVDSSHCHTG